MKKSISPFYEFLFISFVIGKFYCCGCWNSWVNICWTSRPWLIFHILNLFPISKSYLFPFPPFEEFSRLLPYVSEALFVLTWEGTQGTSKMEFPVVFLLTPPCVLQHCWHPWYIDFQRHPLCPLHPTSACGYVHCAVPSSSRLGSWHLCCDPTDPCAVTWQHVLCSSRHWRGEGVTLKRVHLITVVPLPDTVLGRNWNSVCHCFMSESSLDNKFLGVTHSSLCNWNAEIKFLLYGETLETSMLRLG